MSGASLVYCIDLITRVVAAYQAVCRRASDERTEPIFDCSPSIAEHAQQLASGLSTLAQQRRGATGLPAEVRPDSVLMSHGGMPRVREPNKKVIRLIW